MAMSQEERNRRLNIIHMIKDARRLPQNSVSKTPVSSVNEEADPRMRDLRDIQKYLDGKQIPYTASDSLSIDNYCDMQIDLMFLSTKGVKVDPNNNLLRITVSLDDDSCRIQSGMESSCELKKFIGLPKKVASSDFKSIDEILAVCNAAEIYNIYKQKAMNMMQSRMPVAYSMFTGGKVDHVQVRKGDYYWKMGVSTLAVSFDSRLNRYIYYYYPEFILSCAFDEWFLNGKKYSSLEDCYVYLLSFMISHEMMHLIHHNTTTSIDMGESKLDVSDLDKNDITRRAEEGRLHELQNIQQDNFINSQLSRVFRGADGLSSHNALAPMPRMGIGSIMTFRAEHNKGFKKYADFKKLAEAIAKVLSDTMRNPSIISGLYIRNSRGKDNIAELAGADVFISLYVNPHADELRKSSGIFQKFTNEIMKTITDGRMFGEYTKLSDAEKEQDKPIIPNGNLVQVKGSNAICVVLGYDNESKTYELGYTELNVTKTPAGDTQVLCTPSYTSTGEVFGNRRRRDIKPFDPSKNIWYEDSGPREKKTQLSGQDLMQAAQQAAAAGAEQAESDNKGKEPNCIEKLLGYTNAGAKGDPKEAAAGMLDILYNQVHKVEANGFGKDIIDTCIGKPESVCKTKLGSGVYKELLKVLETMKDVGLPSSLDKPEKDDPKAQSSQASQNQPPVYRVGDVVWVRRKRKFGKIVSIKNGQFELEEVEEIGVRVLDDTNKGISEAAGMPRVVLKERVFKSTGRMLGTFSAVDLETFDMEYTENDADIPQGDQQESSGGKKSSVPKPKDDNPLEPENPPKPQSGSNGSSSDGGSDSGEDEGEPQEPDEWDINGNDLDDDDLVPPESNGDSDDSPAGGPPSDSSSGSSDSGDSDSGPSDKSDSSKNNREEGNDQDSESEIDSEDDSGDGSSYSSFSEPDDEDEYSDDMSGSGEGSESDSGDTEYDDSEDSGGSGDLEDEDTSDKDKSKKNRSSSKKDNPKDKSDDSKSKSDKESKPDKGKQSSKPQSGSNGSSSDGSDEDPDYDDPDWDEEDSSGDRFSDSELEKALQEIHDSESETSKSRRQGEEKFEREESKRKESRDSSQDSRRATSGEVSAAKDMLNKAIKEARDKSKSDKSSDSRRDSDFDETDILGKMGAQSLSSNFVPKMASDWKAQLARILDIALGFDIVTNPNLVNKKLEDAPPGREDDVSDIKNIAILLDCSGSMGAREFAKVIAHLDTMFMVRKMDKTNFHIIDWGSEYIKAVADTYVKVKGRMFKRTIMTHKDHGWGTVIIPAFCVASQKLRRPDAIIILTDADIFDGHKMGRTAEGKIAETFVRKFRKRIIWVLTADGHIGKVKEFDPTAKAEKRIIKFHKN